MLYTLYCSSMSASRHQHTASSHRQSWSWQTCCQPHTIRSLGSGRSTQMGSQQVTCMWPAMAPAGWTVTTSSGCSANVTTRSSVFPHQCVNVSMCCTMSNDDRKLAKLHMSGSLPNCARMLKLLPTITNTNWQPGTQAWLSTRQKS